MKVWSKEDHECMEKFTYYLKTLYKIDWHPLVSSIRKAPLDALPQLLVHTNSGVRRAARMRIKKLTDEAVE